MRSASTQMSRLAKLGLLAVACLASTLTVVAISRGAPDPNLTFSACVETTNMRMHYLEPGQNCSALGIGGTEVEWDQAGGLTQPEADQLELQNGRTDDQRDSLAELGREQSKRMRRVLERMNEADAAVRRWLKENSQSTSSIIGNFK